MDPNNGTVTQWHGDYNIDGYYSNDVLSLPSDGTKIRWAYTRGDMNDATPLYSFNNEKNIQVTAPNGYKIILETSDSTDGNFSAKTYDTTTNNIDELHNYITTLTQGGGGYGDLFYMGEMYGNITYWQNSTYQYYVYAVVDETRSFRKGIRSTRRISLDEKTNEDTNLKNQSRVIPQAPDGKILTYKDYSIMIAVFNGIDVVDTEATVSREDYFTYLETGQLPQGQNQQDNNVPEVLQGVWWLKDLIDETDLTQERQIIGDNDDNDKIIKNITFKYETALSDHPDITFYYKNQAENSALDAGGSTDGIRGFITITIDQMIEEQWYTVGILNMSTGVDYRENPFIVKNNLLTAWDIGRSLRFTQKYVRLNEVEITSIVYYYQTDTQGLNGKLSYTDPGSAVNDYAIKSVEYGWHANVKSVTFRGTGTLTNGNRSLNNAEIVFVEGYDTLGKDVFKNMKTVTNVYLSDTITSILDGAFYGSTSLVTVDMKDSITNIGSYVFYGSTFLSNLTLPDTVTSIGEYSFYGTSRLKVFNVPSSLTSITNNMFNGATGITTLTIKDGVTDIGNSAFYEMKSLSTIVLPNSVTSIGEYAFYDTRSLTTLNLPSGMTSIGEKTFSGASGLTILTIPPNITSIQNLAFEATTSLITIVLGSTINSIATNAFTNSTLTNVFLPSTNDVNIPSPSTNTPFYGTNVSVFRISTFEAFNSSSIAYANESDNNPSITLTFKDQNDDDRLDVGATTSDKGFQTFNISHYTNNAWVTLYSFSMNVGQEYRGNDLVINLSNSNYSGWSKKVNPLRFTVFYTTNSNERLETVYYYYKAGLNGLGGTFTYTLPVDINPPIITVTGNNPATAEWKSPYIDDGATADGGETVSTSGTVDVTTIGSYTLTYYATDNVGNMGTATRTVNVVDRTPPNITVQGFNPATHERGTQYSDEGATADGGETITTINEVNITKVGSYKVKYSATDSAGNTGTAERIVNVVDLSLIHI